MYVIKTQANFSKIKHYLTDFYSMIINLTHRDYKNLDVMGIYIIYIMYVLINFTMYY